MFEGFVYDHMSGYLNITKLNLVSQIGVSVNIVSKLAVDKRWERKTVLCSKVFDVCFCTKTSTFLGSHFQKAILSGLTHL